MVGVLVEGRAGVVALACYPCQPFEAAAMKACLKIDGALLDTIRDDLRRPHAFAHERVGFVTAGIIALATGDLTLLARDYRPVADNDYLRDTNVGAMIGPDAIRKGLQLAYGARSALLHVHTHGGRGAPDFSGVDLSEGQKFVPSFFNIVPNMPHGIVVLSDTSARGLLWLGPKMAAVPVLDFVRVGAPYARCGAAR
jgi:hypothetical protein